MQQNNEEELIIPSYFFEVEPPFLLLKLPYCEKNETKSKDFIRKLHKFTNNQFRLAISWNTRKLSSLFRLKDKNLYPACKIYYGKCQCGEYYVGETIRNTTTRWSEHNNPTHKSEPAQHIKTILDICLIGPYYATPHLITKLEKTLKHCLLVLSNHL